MKPIHSLVPAALSLGIALSPDTLAMLGNIAGHTGYFSIVLLLPAMAVFLIFAAMFARLDENRCDTVAENRLIQRSLGSVPIYLPLVVRLCATLFLSTGILVSAGFVFNEIFFHWFPNFGFAFLLLAGLLLLNLAPVSMGTVFQVFFVSVVVLGMMILLVFGLWPGDPQMPATPWKQVPDPGFVCLPFLLWIGMDLGFFAPSGRKTLYRSLVLSVLGAGILFALWALTFIRHVPMDRLAHSSIPHLMAARHAAGDPGRIIMGGIVIFGTLAAINALFSACRINAGHMADQRLLPQFLAHRGVVPVLLAGAIAAMMAGGMAGTPMLESWIRGVWILWLLSLAQTGLAFFRQHRQPLALAAAILSMAGAVFIVLTGDETMLILIKTGFLLGIALIPGAVSAWQARSVKTR
jgi:hypothetical protein